MISRRTWSILLIAAVLTAAMAVFFHRRQALCAEVRHGFTRRAPIAAASGTDRFVCHAMIENLPLRDKLLIAAWGISSLAFIRSFLIDRHVRKTRQLDDSYLDTDSDS